jgi:tRNA pseudouridine55 synthase
MARSSDASGPIGFVVVNKEPGWTSHDVVAKLRGILHTRRTGHAGTLDPSATGVLVVGVGQATRLLSYLTDSTKAYDGTFVLGATTTTLDADGEVTGRFAMDGVTPADVAGKATELTGELLQIPPMVSAVKVAGKRLHELAREGTTIEREPRSVTVTRFEIVATEEPSTYRYAIECSSGTYVRALIDDLGASLGGGAFVATLRRTRAGSFGLDGARTISELEGALRDAEGDVGAAGILIDPLEAFAELPRIDLDDETLAKVRNGAVFEANRFGVAPTSSVAMVSPRGRLVALYEPTTKGTFKPSVVLSHESAQQ